MYIKSMILNQIKIIIIIIIITIIIIIQIMILDIGTFKIVHLD